VQLAISKLDGANDHSLSLFIIRFVQGGLLKMEGSAAQA
jgi:hypothetical protein